MSQHHLRRHAAALLAFVAIALAAASTAAGERITASGWKVTPAGTEYVTGLFALGMQGPYGSAISPDGTHLLVASSGAARYESSDYWNLATGVDDPVIYDKQDAVFYGAVFSPDGKRAWVSGGPMNNVHSYNVTKNGLHENNRIAVGYFPSGIAYGNTPRGPRLYVAENMSGPPGPDAYGNPPGHTVSVINPANDTVTGTIDLGLPLYPLGVTFDRTGTQAYVTNWTGRSVSVIDTATETKSGDVLLIPTKGRKLGIPDMLQILYPIQILRSMLRGY